MQSSLVSTKVANPLLNIFLNIKILFYKGNVGGVRNWKSKNNKYFDEESKQFQNWELKILNYF